MTTATFRFTNTSSKSVVLDSFDPTNLKGATVLGASVVRIGKAGSIGVAAGYPPTDQPPGFRWAQRRAVPGASIPSQKQGTQYVLAVGLARTGTDVGTVHGYRLKYHVDGSSYLLNTHNAARLATDCAGR